MINAKAQSDEDAKKIIFSFEIYKTCHFKLETLGLGAFALEIFPSVLEINVKGAFHHWQARNKKC
jgi:hypothetical protein